MSIIVDPVVENKTQETKEEQERLMLIHRQAIEYCGKQIQED